MDAKLEPGFPGWKDGKMSFSIVAEDGALVEQGGLKKVRYTHEAMVDQLVANPAISQRELAAIFGYTEGWISQVLSSDSFQARLHARKSELVDPSIVASVDVRLQGVARQSMEVISEKLAATRSPDLALRALDISSRALGYGARQAPGVTVQQSFVVSLPAKAQDAQTWINEYSPGGQQARPTQGPARESVAQAQASAPKLGVPPLDLEIPPIELTDGEFQAEATRPPARLEDLIEEAAQLLREEQ